MLPSVRYCSSSSCDFFEVVADGEAGGAAAGVGAGNVNKNPRRAGKARTVESEETRRHLEDAHKRVISVATVQKHLHGSVANSMIEMRPYLATLCTALAQSMISDNRRISIKFNGAGGNSTRRDAESIGLIVTELVINSLKHAFNETTKGGEITVAYDVSGTDWQLSGSAKWSGKPECVVGQPETA